MESGYVRLDVDTMTFEEVMEGLCYNYLKGASEVVAEIDKKILKELISLLKKKGLMSSLLYRVMYQTEIMSAMTLKQWQKLLIATIKLIKNLDCFYSQTAILECPYLIKLK